MHESLMWLILKPCCFLKFKLIKYYYEKSYNVIFRDVVIFSTIVDKCNRILTEISH